MVRDIKYLSSIVIKIFNKDFTIEPHARFIAHFMLITKNMPLKICKKLFFKNTQKTKKFIKKLLDSQSDFFDLTPRSIGINVITNNVSEKMQKSLNVKHVLQNNKIIKQQNKNNEVNKFKRIIPVIKQNLLYTNKKYNWIRIYVKNDKDLNKRKELFINEKLIFKHLDSKNNFLQKNKDIIFSYKNESELQIICSYKVKIVKITKNIYELYVKVNKNIKNNLFKIEYLLNFFDDKKNYSIIFLSELQYLAYNPLLFISNFIKFSYCYFFDKNIFNPITFEETKTISMLLIEACLYLKTKNLSIMPSETHNIFQKLTGERPAIGITKCFKEQNYKNVEILGNRAMQCIDKPADIGANTNYIEIIGELTENKEENNLEKNNLLNIV